MSNASQTEAPPRHPRTLSPAMLVVLIPTAILGAVVGLQLITTLGIIPNTSFIGVVVATALARIPIRLMRPLKSIHAQNLVQTDISTATFIASVSLMVPIGLAYVMGMENLLPAVVLGCVAGMLIDLAMLYWMFDTRAFPASAPWPQGLAAAETLFAGDQGGRRGLVLAGGGVAGFVGAWLGLPMAALGIAFLANVVAMSVFGVGLLASAYAPDIIGSTLASHYIPHGLVIGGGLAALVQVVLVIRRQHKTAAETGSDAPEDAALVPVLQDNVAIANTALSTSETFVSRILMRGVILYLIVGAAVALIAGLWGDLSPLGLVGFVVYVTIACIASQFIMGLSAMHAGWFPSYAVAMLFLVLGLALGFPVIALVPMAALIISGGPAFADAGFDLKTGWIVRGRGADIALEMEGRRQQIIASLLAMGAALIVVLLAHRAYIDDGLIPPIDLVFKATLEAGADSSVITSLLLWAIPGAILQFLGGPSRQVGVLLGAGMLIANVSFGWAILVGLAIRLLWQRLHPKSSQKYVTLIASGMVAGDAVYGVGNATVTSLSKF